jgi:hypothetical protein
MRPPYSKMQDLFPPGVVYFARVGSQRDLKGGFDHFYMTHDLFA